MRIYNKEFPFTKSPNPFIMKSILAAASLLRRGLWSLNLAKCPTKSYNPLNTWSREVT